MHGAINATFSAKNSKQLNTEEHKNFLASGG